MTDRVAIILFVGNLLTACAGSYDPSNASAKDAIIIEPRSRAVSIEHHEAVIEATLVELQKIVGHPVLFRIDAAIATTLTVPYEDAVLSALEAVAQVLVVLRDEDADEFEFSKRNLHTIDIRYVLTNEQLVLSRLDEATKTMVVTGPKDRGALLWRSLVLNALRAGYVRSLVRKFDDRSVSSITKAEYPAYLTYLRSRPSTISKREATDAKGTPSDYTNLLAIVDFLSADREMSSETEKQWNDWLFEQQEHLLNTFANYSEDVVHLSKKSIFWRAASALAEWMAANLGRFSLAEQKRLLFFLYFTHSVNGSPYRYSDFVASRFDALGFGFVQLDAWRKAGYPIGDDDDDEAVGYRLIVCPGTRIENSGSRILFFEADCSGAWYRLATSDDRNRERLVAYLKETKDSRVVEMVTMNLVSIDSDSLPVVLRMLEDTPSLWRAGWRVLAETVWEGQPDKSVYGELRRIWWDHPELKGGVLLSLVHMDSRRHGAIDWNNFKGFFGDSVSEETFRDFLTQSPLAVTLASLVWPVLSPGWSRADALIPYLDNWFADTRVNAYWALKPNDALRYIIDEMCREKNKADLEKIRNYIESRRQDRKDASFGDLIELTQQKQCMPRPKKKKNDTDFGDRQGASLRIIQSAED